MILLLCGSPAFCQSLKIGSPAPEFTITEWLKGEPASVRGGKDKKIYVLEFWATWCLPCIQQIPELNDLQDRYAGSGVDLIAVTGPTRGQRLSEVKQFMESRGAGLSYKVAWDQEEKMQMNYMGGVGAMGIPYMFIIDRQGRVAWHGHFSPYIERVLDGLIAGDLGPETLAKWHDNEPRIQEQFMRFQSVARESLRTRNFDAPLAVLDNILELDPARIDALDTALTIRMVEIGDRDATRAWVSKFVENNKKSVEAMVTLVNLLVRIDAPADRMPDMVVLAGKTAYEATGGADARATAAFAQAAHYVGNLGEAIRLQKVAVDTAPANLKEELATGLRFYESCRDLHQSAF